VNQVIFLWGESCLLKTTSLCNAAVTAKTKQQTHTHRSPQYAIINTYLVQNSMTDGNHRSCLGPVRKSKLQMFLSLPGPDDQANNGLVVIRAEAQASKQTYTSTFQE
jgi:hypothetical protein